MYYSTYSEIFFIINYYIFFSIISKKQPHHKPLFAIFPSSTQSYPIPNQTATNKPVRLPNYEALQNNYATNITQQCIYHQD